jgi:tetratricopeptide (TPR) repeat protein
MTNIKASNSSKNSDPDHVLGGILRDQFPDTLYRKLQDFVREYPSHALGHFYLGFYNCQYRFLPDELGLPVIVFGGTSIHPSRNTIEDRLDKSENHFNLAKSLDPNLSDAVGYNMAWVMLFKRRYGPAILYIEDQLKRNNHEYASRLRLPLGIAYREMGEYDTALSLLCSLPSSDDTPTLHSNIALTYLSNGDLQSARTELLAQLEGKRDEKFEKLLEAIEAELHGYVDRAWMIYTELAQTCKFVAQYEFTGINAAKRAVKLQPENGQDIDDYCDQLSY